MEESKPASFDAVPLPAAGTDPPAPDRRLAAIGKMLENLDEVPASALGNRAQVDQSHENHLVQVRLGIASSLFTALRVRHAPTAAHSLRVSLGCSAWMSVMDVAAPERDAIEMAALLHDIGKVGVPDHVLLKPGLLDEEQAALMARHRELGIEVLSGCCDSDAILDIVRYGSAWYDGSRAGFDLAGEDLPLGARMLSIVDAFDSMTTDHVYRRAMSRERAMAELFNFAGTQFDPQLVREFATLHSSDQSQLATAVVRRWLQDLDPEQANSNWRIGKVAGKPSSPSGISQELLFHEKLLDNMHDGVVFVDSQLVIHLWNHGVERLTGISNEAVVGRRWLPSLVNLRDERGYDVPDDDCPVQEVISTGTQLIRRANIVSRKEDETAVNIHVVPVARNDGSIVGAALLLNDVSSVASLEERVQNLHQKATTDPLTQVANRAEFDRMLAKFVDEHLARMIPCALIICDIDHFKRINDNYGHQAGDDALITFGALLKSNCRQGDLVARYGGEEFVMICADCDNPTATNRAEKLRRELADMPHASLGGKQITASFGATELQAGDTPETMLRRADRALLQAKDMGRNVVVQLGTGLHGAEAAKSASWWPSWLSRSAPDLLLEQHLETTVPLNMAAEKLRGFVADHHAEIVSIEETRVVLRIDGEGQSMLRRRNDRSVPFVIELSFTEKNLPGDVTHQRGGQQRTQIRVVIRPRRNRDRRRRDVLERARKLLMSLKSYLMAHEHRLEEDAEEGDPRQDGVLKRARQIFAPLLGKKGDG